ncbi:MAG: BatD family protein, partial [Fuerstia sp.]|nr:BatD family protein [Fuerstiella sp.]
MSTPATAGDVDVRLSAREAWVGSPVVLQISLNNAEDYEQPTIPDIDGCDIRSAGAPQQSSQTTIINGRRSDSRSVVMQYLITPRREGAFEIPPISIKVDGRRVTTDKLRFVATKSETGNLLFVEIEGGKDKVFVGQPLELTLKIWIKPFHDAEKDITLSEANMWQLISEQTSWGSFLERMQELAANNQRPGGKEVLRDDGQGNERSYYLYEITAMVYPKRPGKIDADDVQIVIDYPTELGKARDPFAGFFEDSGFGGRSPLSQMMGDDFFSSPFSNRLTVSKTRPITGEAQVDATEVLPVPTEGRPADYRGAVGRYKIVTQATPTAVSAGDS